MQSKLTITFSRCWENEILIPGLTELVEKQGNPAPYITIPVAVAFTLLAVGIYIAHYTRFGRTVYAIGGNEGRNEQSARLMGLPVNRTKMLVYTFNGFCSALAGLALSLFVYSGHGLYASGFELEVIASVVMGGTMLTGGSGYVFGTLFGVNGPWGHTGSDPVHRLASAHGDPDRDRLADLHFHRRANAFSQPQGRA